MIRARVILLLLALLAPAAVHAAPEELPDAAEVTERGRSLDRILDLILARRRGEPEGARTLYLLLDPTPSLQVAEFPAVLAAAMERHQEALEHTRIGVARAGGTGRPLLRPTDDFTLVRKTVRDLCNSPSTQFQNVYADVRRVVSSLKVERGRRRLVLVTLENGDTEDDVEATVGALLHAQVRLSVICREAFLSDTYWVLHPPQGTHDTAFTGPDGAFVELPWGFRYQGMPGNTTVLSGFAMHGLTRLASATRGRVYLFYPADEIPHSCIDERWGFCPFCKDDHEPPHDAYQTHRLRALAPLAVSRSNAARIAASDPWYRAVLNAWDMLERYELVYSRPSVRRGSGGARLQRRLYRGWGALGYTTDYAGEIVHARRLLRALTTITADLEDEMERASEQGGIARFKAMAETTRLMLYVTRVNLHLFVAFCREVGPRFERMRADDVEPPEIWDLRPDARIRHIGYRSMSLCHGPKPFLDLRLPGDQATNEALRDLVRLWGEFEGRYAHTPFLAAARRNGLARFHLVVEPGRRPVGRRVPASKDEDAVTLPERPEHPGRPPGRPSGGGTSRPTAPTTGG